MKTALRTSMLTKHPTLSGFGVFAAAAQQNVRARSVNGALLHRLTKNAPDILCLGQIGKARKLIHRLINVGGQNNLKFDIVFADGFAGHTSDLPITAHDFQKIGLATLIILTCFGCILVV
ncbi:MAG: hypothetical protein LBK99_05460 [Opitutaceae bacterium]|nr:hypothetical protein [Opitutaceae bacterium]